MPNLKDKFYEKKIFLVTSGILSIILLTAYIFMIANNNKEPIEPNRYGLDGDSHYYENIQFFATSLLNTINMMHKKRKLSLLELTEAPLLTAKPNSVLKSPTIPAIATTPR